MNQTPFYKIKKTYTRINYTKLSIRCASTSRENASGTKRNSGLSYYRSLPALRTGNGSKAFAGRNSKGRITVRHHGGGHKQALRQIDWNRSTENENAGLVVGFSYDPRRTARLATILKSSEKVQTYGYILAPNGRRLFQTIRRYDRKNGPIEDSSNLRSQKVAPALNPGDSAPLSHFEAGDFLHAVQAFPNQQPIFARAAGTFCQVRTNVTEHAAGSVQSTHSADYTTLRLPSGSHRRVASTAYATYGRVAVSDSFSSSEAFARAQSRPGKAGRSRWLGRRPTVRGVARNPVDHPHGGTSRGRPSVTFKSWPTKGQPTRRPRRPSSSRILTPRIKESKKN